MRVQPVRNNESVNRRLEHTRQKPVLHSMTGEPRDMALMAAQ
jgi:hypothetical protein